MSCMHKSSIYSDSNVDGEYVSITVLTQIYHWKYFSVLKITIVVNNLGTPISVSIFTVSCVLTLYTLRFGTETEINVEDDSSTSLRAHQDIIRITPTDPALIPFEADHHCHCLLPSLS